MLGRRSAWWGAALCLALCLLAWPADAFASPQPSPSPAVEEARPPLILGVAVDEAGIGEADLERARELILSLLDVLPPGSQMMLASFSGDRRIVLPPTADRSAVASSFAGFKAGTTGVALPDGLFDMVGYLGSRQADSRALLLVSAGRVREGDLQFEDPLNAAVSRQIPISALAVGQGDGKLLRRITKITGGEYVRLEVADATMLAHTFSPGAGTDGAVSAPRAETTPTPKPESRGSAGLLGAAAVFFSLGGLVMLGIVFLLIRRLAAPEAPKSAPAPAPPARSTPPPSLSSAGSEEVISHVEDEPVLEKTLVVNANPILRALSGPGAGKNFPLSPTGQTSIGRSRRNDIVVPEDAASAQHCRIDREGDSYVLHDLGATNGTFVNGVRTDRAVLQHGDRLKVGGTVFTVSLFGDRD
ncbi:MAG: FHA domain-containing protein [Vicinamibacteria bacterium]|nr:FHA domain-containing protein [Vicinamibacteria bacterium]